jgi:hypothetical protein
MGKSAYRTFLINYLLRWLPCALKERAANYQQRPNA